MIYSSSVELKFVRHCQHAALVMNTTYLELSWGNVEVAIVGVILHLIL